MRGIAITTAALLASTVAASSSSTACAKGLYILCARGSGEPVVAPNKNYDDWTGSPGFLANQIVKQIPGSVIAGVHYRATDPELPNDKFNLTAYYPSENNGSKAILDEVNSYVAECPDSKIALMGYSQGAQVVQDALCGGLGGPFNSDAPLSPDLIKKNVVAVALFGDPTHIPDLSIDRGTSTNSGVFARKNITACKPYSDFTASWCNKGDEFCDSGHDKSVHGLYLFTDGPDIVKFVVDKWKSSASSGGASGSNATATATATGTGGSSATGTGSRPPTGTASSKPSSASALTSGQSLLLGVVMLLVAPLLC